MPQDTQQFNIRITAAERERWKAAARGQPLATWVRARCNRAADEAAVDRAVTAQVETVTTVTAPASRQWTSYLPPPPREKT